jgi:hypothetical protein
MPNDMVHHVFLWLIAWFRHHPGVGIMGAAVAFSMFLSAGEDAREKERRAHLERLFQKYRR